MRLSARNQIPGKIVEVKKGAVSAEVHVETAGEILFTAMTTVTAVEEMKLREGSRVVVVIKATDVMIAAE